MGLDYRPYHCSIKRQKSKNKKCSTNDSILLFLSEIEQQAPRITKVIERYRQFVDNSKVIEVVGKNKKGEPIYEIYADRLNININGHKNR